MNRFLSALIAILLVAGCSGDGKPAPPDAYTAGGEGKSTPGQRQHGSTAGGGGGLRIEPAEAYRGTTVRMISMPDISTGARIEWLVNGEIAQSGDGLAMETARFRKGDSIQARAAGAARTVLSQVVTIRNSPPEIREIRFVPGTGRQGDGLGVEVDVHDADGDAVQVEIAWRRNGEPAGTGNRLGRP